jgi:uncharacterized membrane protein HdeD (DUF308 family)
MLRPTAVVFGLAILLLGVLGFIPYFIDSGNLFGIFRFNYEYRMAHIFSGILGILCGLYSRDASKLYFLIFGAIFGLFAVAGFTRPSGMLFGMFDNNKADSWFNAVVAIFALFLGMTRK